jgi:hypothetical protein
MTVLDVSRDGAWVRVAAYLVRVKPDRLSCAIYARGTAAGTPITAAALFRDRSSSRISPSYHRRRMLRMRKLSRRSAAAPTVVSRRDNAAGVAP